MLIPAAGSPVLFCLKEGKVMTGDFPSFRKAASKAVPKKSNCCKDCGKTDHESCCTELKQLPDSTLPTWSIELAAPVAMDLPPVFFMIPPVLLAADIVFHPSVPIRGPDSPCAHRAMLAVWRI